MNDALKEIKDALERPFTPEALRSNAANGMTYIPVSEVIARLNAVLGFNWNFTVLDSKIHPTYPDWVVCHGRLEVLTPEGHRVTRDGFGGQWIKRRKNDAVNDLGDEFKGAASDALKKAAQQFGIGLDLARTEDAMWAEEVAGRPAAPAPLVNKTKKLVDSLDPDAKKAAVKFWKGLAGKTKLENALEKDLNTLLEWIESYDHEPSSAPEVAPQNDDTDSHDHLLVTVQDALSGLDDGQLEKARAHWKSNHGGKLESAPLEDLEAFNGFLNLLATGGEIVD